MMRTMCALVLLLSGACDAQNATSATAATAATAGNAGGAGAAGAKDDKPLSKPDDPATAAGATGPVKFNSLSDCLQTCEGGDMIPTNRETCRLNCDTAYGAQPAGNAAGSADPVGKAATCFARCSAADAAKDDCANSCKTLASQASSPPPSDVLDRLGTCIQTCHADKSVLPTNRATCELNCTQAARVVGPAQPATK
jgi:hypothetical protein